MKYKSETCWENPDYNFQVIPLDEEKTLSVYNKWPPVSCFEWQGRQKYDS